LNRTYRTEETLFTQSTKYGAEATAHMNLAVAIGNPRDPRVKKHLEEALRIDPNHALATSSMGLMYMDLGDTERGIRLLERGVVLAPSWPETHTMLAKGYLTLRRADEAFSAAARAAELDPDNLELLYRAARFGLLAGAYDQSLAFLDAIERRNPAYEQVKFFQGVALHSSGRLEEAVIAYESALRRQEASYDIHFHLGRALMGLGRNDQALVHLQRALALRPDSQEAREMIQMRTGGGGSSN
jgi:tetratricopeptide (TPR) repeat protein